MDRLAIIQEQKIVERTVRFFAVEGNIKSMDSMAIIEEQKVVQTTVTLSISKKDGYISYNPRANNP